MRIAQYFHAADHIVVLGDNSIVDQGTWERIGTKATSIAKFHSGREEKDSVILPAGFDKLGAQFRAKDEAEEDLSRQTGDSALYGNIPTNHFLLASLISLQQSSSITTSVILRKDFTLLK